VALEEIATKSVHADDVVTAPHVRARLEGLIALVLGAALAVAYAVLARGAAVGVAEFAYFPFIPDGLPWGAMRGFTWEQLFDHVYRLIVLGPSLVLLSIAAYRLLPSLERLGRIDARRVAWTASLVAMAALAFAMLVVLRGRAIVDDELAYQMQAGFLWEGRITAKDVGYYPTGGSQVLVGAAVGSKYLFGEGLVQMLGRLVDLPALLHLPLAALSLLAFYRALLPGAGRDVAGWSTAFLAVGPMFVLTSATGQSQCTALACIALAGWGLAWTRGERPRAGALLVASSLAFCAMTRPQSAVPAAVVLGGASALALARRRDWLALALMIAVGIAGLATIGAYDKALTGSATKLPWFLQCSLEHYGFGHVWDYLRYRHTPWTALQNLLVVAVRFNAWWLGWPLGLAVVAVWWVLGRPARGCGVWFGVGVAVVAFEIPYYSTGVSDTGPIYHFELLLPASVLAANTLLAALDRWPRASAAALVVHLVGGTAAFLAIQTARVDRLVTAMHRDADAALARIPGRAILLVETRNSEVLRIGWIFADFPVQNRSDRDRVVTFSRPPRKYLPKLFATYPGRSCWYYHRDPATERAQLLTCADAERYLDRPFVDDALYRDIWVRPTAFKRTSFDPYTDANQLEMRPTPRPCCAVHELQIAGADVEDPERCDP